MQKIAKLGCVAFLSLFLLAGCGKEPEPIVVVEPDPLPKWIETTQEDDANYFYAVERDSDENSSIQKALETISQKLIQEVQAKYESDFVVQQALVSQNPSQELLTDVRQISIEPYDILNTYEIESNDVAVMLSVHKATLSNKQIPMLDQEREKIDQTLIDIRYLDILTRYNKKQELSLHAKALVGEALVASLYNKEFDTKEYLAYIADVHAKFDQEAKGLNFYVQVPKKAFRQAVIEEFKKDGFLVVKSQRKDSVLVKLRIKDNIKIGHSLKDVTLKINVKVFHNLAFLGEKDLEIKVPYSSNTNDVYIEAAKVFEKRLKSGGLNGYLGINLDVK